MFRPGLLLLLLLCCCCCRCSLQQCLAVSGVGMVAQHLSTALRSDPHQLLRLLVSISRTHLKQQLSHVVVAAQRQWMKLTEGLDAPIQSRPTMHYCLVDVTVGPKKGSVSAHTEEHVAMALASVFVVLLPTSQRFHE